MGACGIAVVRAGRVVAFAAAPLLAGGGACELTSSSYRRVFSTRKLDRAVNIAEHDAKWFSHAAFRFASHAVLTCLSCL